MCKCSDQLHSLMHLSRLYYFLGDTETNSYQPLHMNFIYSPKVGYNVSVSWDVVYVKCGSSVNMSPPSI